MRFYNSYFLTTLHLIPPGSYSFLESRGFLDYTIAIHHTDKRGNTNLHVMKEYIAPFGIGLAYPKFVPYISKFNKVIRRLTEAGLAKRWMKDIILRGKFEELSRKVVSVCVWIRA